MNFMKTNIEKKNVMEWLTAFDSAARGQSYAQLYKRLHSMLNVPSRKRRAVSIFRLNSLTNDGDIVIIPRKLVSSGKLDHKVTVTALEYSAGALKALKESGSKALPLKDMMAQKKIRIVI